jgi:hypothetical protein
VAVTFPAEGTAQPSLNFFWGEAGWCHAIDFLSAVQSVGSVFHPQWRSVIKSFDS